MILTMIPGGKVVVFSRVTAHITCVVDDTRTGDLELQLLSNHF